MDSSDAFFQTSGTTVTREVRASMSSMPRMSARRTPALVALLALCACSGSRPASHGATGTSVADRNESGLPIEAILVLSGSDQAALESSLRSEVEECMSSRGFSLKLPVYPPSSSVFSLASRYGTIPSEDPATWGYRDPELIDLSRRQSVDEDELSIEETVALIGDPSHPNDGNQDDCYSLARTLVYGSALGVESWPGYQQLIDLQLKSLDELYASKGARAIVDKWSSCMAENGYHFRDWWEAPNSFSFEVASSEDISEEERLTASSDKSCRESLDFELSLLKLESIIQARELDKVPAVINQYTEASRAAVVRANKSRLVEEDEP